VRIALGSHGELETCIELSRRLKFLRDPDTTALFTLTDSVGRLLGGLHRSLSEKIGRKSRKDPPALRPRPPRP
jgi:four helix bundle protein